MWNKKMNTVYSYIAMAPQSTSLVYPGLGRGYTVNYLVKRAVADRLIRKEITGRLRQTSLNQGLYRAGYNIPGLLYCNIEQLYSIYSDLQTEKLRYAIPNHNHHNITVSVFTWPVDLIMSGSAKQITRIPNYRGTENSNSLAAELL